MATRERFIASERMGAWIVTTLGVALAAFVLAAFGVMEARTGATVTQVEIIKLNERIQALEAKSRTASAPASAAAVSN